MSTGRALVAATVLFTACTPPPRPPRPAASVDRAAAARAALDGLYPPAFQALHRVVLSVHGRDFAFTGYVLCERPARARVVAFSELGGTIFDVIVTPDGAQVVRAAPGLAARWLEQGVGGAVRALYLWQAKDSLVLTDGDGLAVVDRTHAVEHHVDARGRLSSTETSGAVPFRLDVRTWGQVEGAREPVPVTVLAKNVAAGYTLEVSVLRIAPVEPDGRRFAVPARLDGGS